MLHDDLFDGVIIDNAKSNRAAGDEHFEVAGTLRTWVCVDCEVFLAHVERLH